MYTENHLCFIFYKVSYTASDITKKNTGIMNTGPRGPCSILPHPALCPWNWLMWTTSKFPLCSGFWFGQSKGNTAGLRGLCKSKERLPFFWLSSGFLCGKLPVGWSGAVQACSLAGLTPQHHLLAGRPRPLLLPARRLTPSPAATDGVVGANWKTIDVDITFKFCFKWEQSGI